MYRYILLSSNNDYSYFVRQLDFNTSILGNAPDVSIKLLNKYFANQHFKPLKPVIAFYFTYYTIYINLYSVIRGFQYFDIFYVILLICIEQVACQNVK